MRVNSQAATDLPLPVWQRNRNTGHEKVKLTKKASRYRQIAQPSFLQSCELLRCQLSRLITFPRIEKEMLVPSPACPFRVVIGILKSSHHPLVYLRLSFLRYYP